jgi:hypothetical protein
VIGILLAAALSAYLVHITGGTKTELWAIPLGIVVAGALVCGAGRQ